MHQAPTAWHLCISKKPFAVACVPHPSTYERRRLTKSWPHSKKHTTNFPKDKQRWDPHTVPDATERRMNQRPGVTKQNWTPMHSPLKKGRMLRPHMIPTTPGKLTIPQCFIVSVADTTKTIRETVRRQPSLGWKALIDNPRSFQISIMSAALCTVMYLSISICTSNVSPSRRVLEGN